MANKQSFTWFKSHKIILFILLLVLIIGIVGIVSVVRAPGKNNNEVPANNTKVTRTGKAMCLPHKGDGPHTMECAIGLQVEDKYYALKDDAHPGESPLNDVTNKRIEVTGQFTLTKNSPYDIVGTIAISKLKVLEQ